MNGGGVVTNAAATPFHPRYNRRWMKLLLIVGAVSAGLWLLHRLLLCMEAHGWIYYVHKKPDPASLGTAFLELNTMAEPQKRHVLELKRSQRTEHNDAAGPDEAGGT